MAKKNLQQQIDDFKQATGIQLDVKGDRLVYDKTLYLRGKNITELPENLTVGGYLNLRETNVEKLPDDLKVNGGLNLESTPIKELPDKLTVNGSLNLYDTQISQLPDNLTVNGNLNLMYTPIKELPENLTVGENLYVYFTQIEKLPQDLKVAGNIWMNDWEIKATADVLTPDGYIDLVKADAPIQQNAEFSLWDKLSALLMDTNEDKHLKAKEDDILVLETNEDMGLSDLEKNHLSEVWQHPSEGIITFKMEGSNQELDLSEFPEFIPQVYNHVLEGNMETISVKQQLEDKLISLSELAAQTQKVRPSDIVFVRDFDPDRMRDSYTAYGKDADRLAEKVSSSVVTMRPEIDGQRYPNATVNSGNIEAVRADMMFNNVHPVIIDLEGNRITNDKTLDYTKEERKAFLDSLKPETKQRQDIAETIQRLGSPDSIAVPQLYNSHSVYAGPELAVPHRFGYQEVPVLQLLKSKNGSYRAGNDEDGYFPIAKMDTNNLYEVQKALIIVENNRPQKLIEELQKQVESGKASVEKDLAENHYKFTIYDQQGDLYYPRGNKSFTLNTKENDKIYLHPDNANYVTEHKVNPQLIKQLTGYAETKLGIQHTQSPFHKIEDFFIRNVNGEWRLSANIDGKKMPEVTAAHNDVVEYKHGRISKEEISIKTYGDLLNNKQEQSHNRGRGLH